MRRFHIAIAVADLERSIADYRERLGEAPAVIVPGRYAMWRTGLLNFSISERPALAGSVRHIGFEDDDARGFTRTRDHDGIEWELFSPAEQDARIRAEYGPPRAC